MAHTTHYEVHVKQNGRWEIHARYSATEKEASIEEAKSLDALKHIESVKVIQEIYDMDDGTSKEYNVYAPGQKKYRPPSRTAAKQSSSADNRSGAAAKGKSTQKPKASLSFTALIMRMLAITLFSTIVGGLFTWFTSMVTAETSITKNAQINIMIITFLVTFVMAAIPMAMIFLGSKKN